MMFTCSTALFPFLYNSIYQVYTWTENRLAFLSQSYILQRNKSYDARERESESRDQRELKTTTKKILQWQCIQERGGSRKHDGYVCFPFVTAGLSRCRRAAERPTKKGAAARREGPLSLCRLLDRLFIEYARLLHHSRKENTLFHIPGGATAYILLFPTNSDSCSRQ